MDDRRRLVAAPPSGLDETPHGVDVLADPQGAVEPADRPQGLGADEQRGGRHVAEAGARRDPAGLGPEIERGVALLVARDGARRGPARHPRRHEGHLLVGEVAEERFEPARRELHVGVDEGDEGRRDRAQAGVAGDGRPGVRPQPEDLRAVDRGDRRIRCVVDDDERGHAGTAGDDVADGPRVDAERGHDHGDGSGGVRRALGPGMDRPGVEEPVDELRRRDVLAGGDLFEGPDASGGQAEQPQR